MELQKVKAGASTSISEDEMPAEDIAEAKEP